MGHPPPAITPESKGNDRYIVMGVDFGVFRVADFDNDLRFNVRRLTRHLRVTRRPPSHLNLKEKTDISSWVSILGVLRLLFRLVTTGISNPENPEFDTHDYISVNSFIFLIDSGRRLTHTWQLGRRMQNL